MGGGGTLHCFGKSTINVISIAIFHIYILEGLCCVVIIFYRHRHHDHLTAKDVMMMMIPHYHHCSNLQVGSLGILGNMFAIGIFYRRRRLLTGRHCHLTFDISKDICSNILLNRSTLSSLACPVGTLQHFTFYTLVKKLLQHFA